MTTERREIIALDYLDRFHISLAHGIIGPFVVVLDVCFGSKAASQQFSTWAAAYGQKRTVRVATDVSVVTAAKRARRGRSGTLGALQYKYAHPGGKRRYGCRESPVGSGVHSQMQKSLRHGGTG